MKTPDQGLVTDVNCLSFSIDGKEKRRTSIQNAQLTQSTVDATEHEFYCPLSDKCQSECPQPAIVKPVNRTMTVIYQGGK
jgi:hypothetical protein